MDKNIIDGIADTLISAREAEIMDWVKLGKTNMEIGMILNISSFTVKNHLQRIFKKLDVLNRAQAATQYQKAFQNQ
jgi:DNA-binding CsgD family transcriptional regulator